MGSSIKPRIFSVHLLNYILKSVCVREGGGGKGRQRELKRYLRERGRERERERERKKTEKIFKVPNLTNSIITLQRVAAWCPQGRHTPLVLKLVLSAQHGGRVM